jgi:hypothetical protein
VSFQKTTRIIIKKRKAKETLSQTAYNRDGSSRDNKTGAGDSNSDNKNKDKDKDKEAPAPIKTKALRYNSSCNSLAERENTRILLRKKNKA